LRSGEREESCGAEYGEWEVVECQSFCFSQKFMHRQSEKRCCNDGEINPLISIFQAIFTANFTADAARLSVVVLIYNLSMQNSHNAQLL
jgi:hypothetical protein